MSIDRVKLDVLEKKCVFIDKYNNEYNEKHPLYAFAGTDFLNSISYTALFYSHGVKHFHFVDVMAKFAYELSISYPNSNLNLLLTPHVIHTLYINDDVLRTTQLPIENKPEVLGRLFYPFGGGPFDAKSITDFFSEQLIKECLIPPKFNIYSKFDEQIQKFYNITKSFVTKLMPYLEDELLSLLAKQLDIASINICSNVSDDIMIDILSTFIWQVSFLHSMEHFAAYMAFRYLPDINTNFQEKLKIKGDIPITVGVFNKDINDIMPSDKIYDIQDGEYVIRTGGTWDLFVKFHRVKEQEFMNMKDIDYGFFDKLLVQFNEEFNNDLIEYVSEITEIGELITPLEMISSSINWQ